MTAREPTTATAPDGVLRGLLERPPLPELQRLAAAHDGPVHVVGGAVRDALLGRDPVDIDVLVGDRFTAFVDAVARAVGRRPSPLGDRWRDTHRLRWKGRQVDLARPLEPRQPVERDLRARDFTINAMAVPLGKAPADTALIDPCGGRADLEGRCLRCPAEAVLDEDPLRLLRAVRYVAVLDGFRLDAALAPAIAGRVGRLAGVARERIQTEWQLLLEAPGWHRALMQAEALGLTGATLVPVVDPRAVDALAGLDTGPVLGGLGVEEWTVRLAAVLWHAAVSEPAAQLADSLVQARWPSGGARFAARAAAWARTLEGLDDDTLVERALRDRGGAAVAAVLCAAVRRREGGKAPPEADELHRYARRAGEDPWVTGRDLRSWGMPEGPELGALLEDLGRGQVQRRWRRGGEARAWARRTVAEVVAAAGRPDGT